MVKRSKADASAGESAVLPRKEKKQKKSGSSHTETAAQPASSGSFSLFSENKVTALDDIFSKGAAFAVATPSAPPRLIAPIAVASSSKVDEEEEPVASSSKPKKSKKVKTAKAPERVSSPVLEPETDEEDEEGADLQDLVHETVKSAPAKRKEKGLGKYIPTNESASDRDRRTIFVGNLPLEIVKAKSGLSQLRAHLLTFVPTAKIESIRFRSVPFATPTVNISSEDADPTEEGLKRAKREKERAAAWRAQQDILEHGGEREKEEIDTSKSFIDAKGKRRVAFIKKDFHSDAANCNAYVVFAHPHPDRPSNLPPILDPFEAAQKALSADGSSFQDRTIRVDTVRLPSSEGLAGATNNLSRRNAWTAGSDPKKSVFVGGLDYAAKEEDLRVFFEEMLKAERGAREGGAKWVESVRIVRDKDTQLGKGFGYVHFTDNQSVDEVLAMEATKLKFAKKPLRVQRCKTLPSAAVLPKSKATNETGKPAQKAKAAQVGPIPKGNPALGEKIKDLSKEERKVVKSSDNDRQARRLAKKKLRGKLGKDEEKGAVKLTLSRGEKERGKKNKVVAKKGRVRSSHALSKMKGSRN